ncbi:YhjD/YihY/BrkB family envelope integrity protein [Kitasatospora sp. NPDC057015]|uniref:YhjD/YihY/BrkB family envelope integrity protein n=1 Tax=Kitasatospora sp. NPDC057015 TaxID=3346001 RepID=UPI0036287ABF
MTGNPVATAQRLRRQLEERLPVITRVAGQLLEVNLLEAGTRLAAQCFLTAVPLLFVAAAVAPKGFQDQVISSLRSAFGLYGGSEDQLRALYRGGQSNDLREAVGAASALMALLSATAFSRAMQRVCERAWQLGKSGTRIVAWRWLVWVASWFFILAVQGPLRNGFGLGQVLGIPLSVLSSTLVWWWTQHLLLGGRMRWLPLLPGAVLTGIAMSVLSITARLYIPAALNRSLAEYGGLGPVFTLLSWLIALCAVVTGCLTVGAVLAGEPFLARYLGTPTAVPQSQSQSQSQSPSSAAGTSAAVPPEQPGPHAPGGPSSDAPPGPPGAPPESPPLSRSPLAAAPPVAQGGDCGP